MGVQNMIQVYSRENTNYTANGDMTLLPTSCVLACELNGIWELTMSHPIDSDGRWKCLEEESVIACPTFQGDKQLFRVDKCIKTESSVEITAYPIFFDSADDCFLLDVRPTDKSAQDALNIMMSGSKYSGTSDIIGNNTAYFIRRNLMDAINGDDEPNFIGVWGGEILFNNYQIIINERVGGDYGAEIRYGKNMNGLSHTVDMSDVVTRIIPVAYNGRMMSGSSPWVDSENINKYAKKYIREIKFEDVKLAEDAESQQDGDIVCQTQEELNAALTQKCEDMYAVGADLPAVTIEVNMIDLSRTVQYQEFQDLVTVALGDTVHCYNSRLDISTDARCIKLTWDCIRNQPEGMTLGDFEYNYFSDLTSSMQSIDKVIRPDGTVIAEQVSGILDAINTQMRYQKNIAQKSDVRAILFEDLDPDSPTYGAMCWGTLGFQIASSRTADGRDWDWKTFGTGQGFFADLIVAGTMLADRIQGGTLTLGGSGNGNGVCRVLDANGNEIARIDRTGVTATQGSFSGTITASGGKIGGWNIGLNELMNQIGNNKVTIANGSNQNMDFLVVETKDQNGNTVYPFWVRANGQVGINLVDQSASTPAFTIGNIDGAAIRMGGDGFEVDFGQNWAKMYYLNQDGAVRLSLGSGDTEYVRIDSDGLIQTKYPIKSSAAPNVHMNSSGAILECTDSTRRIKNSESEDLGDMDPEALYRLPVKTYKYNDGYLSDKDPRCGQRFIGFMAEDTEEIYPYAVDYDDDGLPRNWNIRVMVPAMMKLIQRQHGKIIEMEEKINEIIPEHNS